MSTSIRTLFVVTTCAALISVLADTSDACRRASRRCCCVVVESCDGAAGKGDAGQEHSEEPGERDYWNLETATEMPMRRWVDNTAQYTTVAKLHEIRDSHVRLLKESGRFCTVPLDRLSPADQVYVQQQSAAFGSGVVGRVAGR